MKFLPTLLLPILLAFAFSAMPTSPVSACGSGGDCCKKEVMGAKKICCEKEHGQSKPGNEKKGCSGHCGKNGCPCPSPAPHFLAIPAYFQSNPRLPLIEQEGKADWYFLNKIPTEVVIPSWLPPKI